ncbi:carboxypeptidase M32 [Bacillus lacus]|uniref:Metal-dependent carboxypeptidase n=1 Tax=Metabacillus lacus TaxID=1983721 RepID=A0A7X2IW80_9BACI|nr:carboxypeptidase M32 [Metabacillus lacus]MRX70937.1 carboxypeptidase M32 [Metabacillus lacus]
MEGSEKKFYDYLATIQGYNEAINLMYWDLRTGAPKKGVESRSQAIGTLSAAVFDLKTSDEMKHLLDELSADSADLSQVTVKAVEEARKDYDQFKKIPAAQYKEYVILQSQAESIWEEAKEASDFSLFAPYLKKLVTFNKEFLEYWGYEGNKYNTLLDFYEPGMTVEVLDRVFGELRESIVPLVASIGSSSNQPETDFLFRHFPKEKQAAFNTYILENLGYDFSAGRLDETVHPFAISLNSGDVRITTKYDEQDFRTAVFGTIHECGHAVYEQNISKKLTGTNLCDGTSMGIHESQSLFFENFIARNKGFWKKNYSKLQEISPEQFRDIELDDYYFAINESKPSLIRIEADELTYPLHIMIRYEIEKGLFNDEIEVEDLPEIWNKKYEEYLGITPPNDAKGVLQDVHWSGGSFGYFPSYALGYMYAAQLKQAMLKDLQNFDELIEQGNISPVKEWLTEKVHTYGKLKKPLDIIKDATGEELKASYLIDYLNEKYSRLYKL